MEWLNEARGQGLLWQEARLVSEALESVFGDVLLQVGVWGELGQFTVYSRTRTSAVLGLQRDAGELRVDAVTEPTSLAVASDSVDAVLLPHTLETASDPYQVLREIDRVLRPDGRLIVLGFNSPGWWAARQRLSDGGFLPGVQQIVGDHRLSDWLKLLGFAVGEARYYHPAASVDRVIVSDSDPAMDTQVRKSWWYRRLSGAAPERRGFLRNLRGWRNWRLTAACYIVEARKEVATMTPLKPSRFIRPRLVGGLVNPTTRNIARVHHLRPTKPET